MNLLLRNIFKENKSDIAKKKVKELSKKFIYGLSIENDIVEWESNFELIRESEEQYYELFLKYLLKHYPNDKRLEEKYCNRENIDSARSALYRESLLLVLGDALYMLKNRLKDFVFLDEWKRNELITKIENFICFENKNRGMLFIKENSMSSDILEHELEEILKDVFSYMPRKTLEQYEWHKRAKSIGTFKYLAYDGESIFRKRCKLGLKHGFMLGGVGSGKTKAVQKEIELILEHTKDNIVVLDNDGKYEEFCNKNNGKYINIANDIYFFNNAVSVYNRLTVLDITKINDTIKFQYASNALEYAYQRIIEQAESSKNTWLYIEEVNELIFDDGFIDMHIQCRRKNGIITIVTNRVMEIIKKPIPNILFSNSSYVRYFRQSPINRESIAKFLYIDADMLQFDDIETSWAIVENKLIKIKEKI